MTIFNQISATSWAVALCAGICAGPAVAWDYFERLQVAQSLGTIIASEQFCGLLYDQAAIQLFVEENVPASDMQFPSQLQLMTQGSAFELQTMLPSAKTAHCAQVSRVARSNKFIK